MPRIGNPAKVFIGIDPGLSGGLAAVWSDGKGTEVIAMPSTRGDLYQWLCCFVRQDAFAVIEKVQGYIGKAHPGNAMFKFGKNAGELLMALTAARIPHEEVTPQRWQKALGIPSRKRDEPKGAFKNRLKSKAQALFPDVQVTLKTCDALLISEFCRRLREGKP